MDQSIVFITESNNSYIYDQERMLSMVIHPKLKDVIEGISNSNLYYKKKYNYLKRWGFFSKKQIDNIETNIDEAKVKQSIIQTPQILFEVTDFCNLNCTYCALGEMYQWTESRNKKNLNIHSAISLLRYIFDLKMKSKGQELVISFYGGEPLLNINIIKEIIDAINRINSAKIIKVKYSMTTNAILINKYIDFLVENDFNILISLDGNCENNSYRVYNDGRESFKKVIDNIDLVQYYYPDYFKNNINFNAVLHNRNSVKNVYEFIYNRYNKIPQVSELSNTGINPSKEKIFKEMYQNIRQSESEYNKEANNLLPHNGLISFHEITNFLKYLSINMYLSNIRLLLYKRSMYFPSNTCLPFSKKIFLTTRDTLLPCERINYDYSLGKIDSSDGSVIINTKEIADRYTSYYKFIKDICQLCYVYKFCGLCMFHITGFQDTYKRKPKCTLFHNKDAFKSKMKRIFSFLERYPNDINDILENLVIVS